MANPIIKLGDHYLVWSTIVDAPITYGMTRDELTEFIREEYGNEGLRELPRRLVRVDAKGTSAFRDQSVDDTITVNRAGPNERQATKEEIVRWFCVEKRSPKEKARRRAAKGAKP